MKLIRAVIHNIRSIQDADIHVSGYSVIVGANNAGKTNFITALRLFYENEKLSFSKDRDFPKFETDEESWIELTFDTTEDEQEQLKEEYRDTERQLRVRRYFASADKDRVKSGQSNIFAYEKGSLSKNLFYGAKNISQAKLGSVIYIPAVSKADDTMKLTGPSPFRDLVNLVMKKAVSASPSFETLSSSFESFNADFRAEAASDGTSVDSLITDINSEVGQWGVQFGVDINPVKPEDIVKNLLSHHIEDTQLDGQRVNLGSHGQGLQRHLIFTLIRLSARYGKKQTKKTKDFNPDFSLLLFEEPEAFLHPPQQDVLCLSLQELAGDAANQVFVSSHSARFISKQLLDIPSIIRVQRFSGKTSVHQVLQKDLEELLDENLGLLRAISEAAGTEIDETGRLADESMKYFLWLDAERSGMFFGRHVVICEGATERAFFAYLLDNHWKDLREKQVYFTDCLGKYNIHRFVGLLSALGVSHSILYDLDSDAGEHKVINEFIQSKRTALTTGIRAFEKDIEDYLGVPKPPKDRQDLKPLNLLKALVEGKIPDAKISDLREVIDTIMG
ncbi:MAG: AAA family ATPase [Gammaproteobacteria bacterium]|nr:AAA family ATPase [Gammaproteobacteria bacterium]